MPTITLDDFDSGLYLLGGRDQIPPSALRNATGVNPVCMNSLRQRNGNVQLSTLASISMFVFYNNLYTLDDAGIFYKNFVSIKSGLLAGNRASIVKAPPHFGSSAYMFVAGTGSQFKVDSVGNVTNWGIAAPADGVTAVASFQPINISINTLDSTAGLSSVNGAALSTDNTNFVTGTGSLFVDIDKKLNGGFKQTVALNLMPPGSSDDDFIQFYVLINDTTLFKGVVVSFDLGTNYHHDYYTYNAPFSSFIAAPLPPTPQTSNSLDNATGLIHGQAFANPSPVAPTPLGQEWVSAYKTYLNKKLGSDPSPSFFSPSSGAQNLNRLNAGVATASAQAWWLVQIPRGAFKRVGGNTSLTWANVSGYKIEAKNFSPSNKLDFNFDDIRFIGGTGLLGTYQYFYTYLNPTTGSYSQPNPTPITVVNVARTGVTLGNFTASSDPQATQLIIWRTMGNGGIFYKCAVLAAPFPTTFIDYNSDFIGFGPNPANTANPLADWTPATVFATGALIQPTVGNPGKFVFVANSVSGTGTSGGSHPVWPQPTDNSVGQTVVDNAGGNQIVWQNLGTVLSLGIEPLLQVNVLPAATVTQCAYYKGTMFLCGDTAVGSRGRIYYSSPGYAEGVAGFTDITNDDDPTTGFAIFNNNLYVFTQKALWLVIDVSINTLLPGFTVVQQMGAPGCTAPYSIVSTPNALIYQGPDGLYAFDGYYAEAIMPQILPLFRGETVEGYAPIGKIIAATYGRDEYWFSDGATKDGGTSNATWAANVMPSSRAGKSGAGIVVRQHSMQPSDALFFYQTPSQPTTSIVFAGWNATTAKLEVPGTFTDPGPIPVAIAWRPRSLYSGSKYTFKVQRAFFDINPGGANLNAYISLDGTDYFLGGFTGTTRQKFDFTFNKSGSVVGLYLINITGATSLIELFTAGIETDKSGEQDIDK